MDTENFKIEMVKLFTDLSNGFYEAIAKIHFSKLIRRYKPYHMAKFHKHPKQRSKRK